MYAPTFHTVYTTGTPPRYQMTSSQVCIVEPFTVTENFQVIMHVATVYKYVATYVHSFLNSNQ